MLSAILMRNTILCRCGSEPFGGYWLRPLVGDELSAALAFLGVDRGRVFAEFRLIAIAFLTAGRSPISSSQRFTLGNSSMSIFRFAQLDAQG